ncbi:hypothetical protein Lfu02_05280 [Longispora fulva]|uniref:Uncharacterized protein n=1 Tax=Longispora fulva TaxID=619741 RepID=A0A8J7GCI3_9ACTN|nr:DUF6365 family protein [Longispora fulva]MBG6135605.1 hypothetical protein [Longispora fulva]GIG56156.1 hypothetical protein Lfu02_05280 [Longispora fulva]
MRLLFLAPSQLSKGDAAVAADLARQIPRKRLQVGFVAAAEAMPQLHDLGMPTLPLNGSTPAENQAILDRVVRGFRPDCLIAADAFAVDQSSDWSGLTLDGLRERYDCPVGSIDRVGWQATDYTADLYGGDRVQMPRLLDGVDLVIRPCPPHAPTGEHAEAGRPTVVYAGLHRGGLKEGGLRPVDIEVPATGAERKPVVFIANSEWEYRNPRESARVAQLIEALPGILHSHLAALGRPLHVVHVGPEAWQMPIAEHIEYRHFTRLPYPMFHARLSAADLFVTTNVLSATLGRAVLAGVPALVLQNRTTVEEQAAPEWLATAAPRLQSAHPFRVAPLGWYDLLDPLLTTSPYQGCFATGEIFDRDDVLQRMSALLDDSAGQRQRQADFHESLADLPPPLEALRAAVAR